MKIRKIILFALLLVMMVGAVSASDNTTDDAVNLDDNSNAEIGIQNTEEISAQDTELLKQTNEDTLSASRTYDIYNYNNLHSVLTSDTYDQLTLNIKSNIKLGGDTDVNTAITRLTINGNGKTIDGDSKYQFLYLASTQLTLKNLKIVNCRGQYGGAIENDADYTSITNCVFSNCQAYDTVASNIIWIRDYVMKMYGGAIYSQGDHITISNNLFENNYAVSGNSNYQDQYMRGGAIYNYGDYATITNNIFKYNAVLAKEAICRGGAIYNYGDNVRISNNEFDSNKAQYGGAVYSVGYTCIISNNKFKDNYAGERGSALYNTGRDTIINSNNFKDNMIYNSKDNIIENSGDDTQLSNNKLVSTDSYNKGTLINSGDNVIIKNNVFDNRRDTIISAPAVANYGGYVVVTLKDDRGNPMIGVKVKVTLKGTKTYTTNKKGQIKIPTTGLALKKYTAKIRFAGNAKYIAASTKVKISIKKGTQKIVAKAKTFKKSKKVKKYKITIKNKAGKAIKKAKVTIKIKGKVYKATTNKKGKATFNLKINKKGKFKATIKVKASKYYKKASKKVKIKVK